MSLGPTTPASSKPAFWLCVVGLLLLIQQLFVVLIAEQFLYEVDIAKAPIHAFVISQISAGFIFLLLLPLIPQVKASRKLILLVILLGLSLRFSLFGSIPIMEIDFYRYLWDGAVTASGFNPWQFSPEMISNSADIELQWLSRDAGVVFERINYADLRTIYPPLTQLFFTIAFWLDNWDLDAWRFILLTSDMFTLALVFKILQALKRSPLWSIVYWWNPLVIHETYNTLHMDVLLLPFLLLAGLWMIRRQFIAASGALTLAAGIKLWPLLLLPFALRPLLFKPRQLVIALLTILIIAIAVIAPLFYFGLGEHSGLQGYSQDWVRNSALFPLLNSIASSFAVADSGLITRIFIALFLTTLVLYLNRRETTDVDSLVRNLCWVVVALFLLSPTQFPWYTTWFAPLLCFYPKPAFLLLVGLMPIYYFRVYFETQGNVALFDNVIVWLQYLPVYILLSIEILRYRNRQTMAEVHV